MTLLFAGHDTTTVDDRVPVPRARPRRPTGPTAPTGDDADLELCARRDAAPVPAGVDRPAPAIGRLRVRRPRRSRPARPSTTPRGSATACPTSGTSPIASGPSASPPSSAQGDPQGRLRAVRRRLAHLHRDALRPGGDPADRARGSCATSASSCPPATDDDPPDADHRPDRRPAGDDPRRGLNGTLARVGRLAQLVRAPRLHRGGRWFEPSSAHHVSLSLPSAHAFSDSSQSARVVKPIITASIQYCERLAACPSG